MAKPEGAEMRKALSADIHLLGDLPGQVILDQEGQPLFDSEERVRGLANVRLGNTHLLSDDCQRSGSTGSGA